MTVLSVHMDDAHIVVCVGTHFAANPCVIYFRDAKCYSEHPAGMTGSGHAYTPPASVRQLFAALSEIQDDKGEGFLV